MLGTFGVNSLDLKVITIRTLSDLLQTEGLQWTITHDIKLHWKWEAADTWMTFKYQSYALKKKKKPKEYFLILISLSLIAFYFLDFRMFTHILLISLLGDGAGYSSVCYRKKSSQTLTFNYLSSNHSSATYSLQKLGQITSSPHFNIIIYETGV